MKHLFKDDYKSMANTHCHVIYFTGVVSGNLKIKRDEIESVIYLTKEEILESKNIGFDHQDINWFIQKKKLKLY